MPTPLKYIYNDLFFKVFHTAAKKTIPGFNENAFTDAVKQANWEELELKQRMRRIATVLQNFLPGNYAHQLEVLIALAKSLQETGGLQYGSLALMFLPDFVEQFGQGDLERSLSAMEQITPITSCEFAIRPFLKCYPKETMLQMQAWSKHPNEHVRRLASEGCRPRLPWGMTVDLLKKNPTPILPILEQLKNDHSEYVRRSVANNLNDISKDHPSLILELTANWIGKTPNTDRLLKHACRGLLKSGNSNALRLFGTASDVPCAVSECQLSTHVITKGESIQFLFDLHLLAKTDALLRIEYAVHFMKANGKTQPKVFKIGERLLRPEQKLRFSRSHAFKDLTTRKHYPGSHQLVIIINGIAKQTVSFLLLEDAQNHDLNQ